MDKKKIVAIIPIRKNSQRIKNKNFLDFFKGKSLLELKIEQLKKVKNIDEIVVSSDSELAKKISKRYDVSFHAREKYFASSLCSGSKFFENLARCIDGDYLMYCPCTSPIIKQKTYNLFLNKFESTKYKYDSLNTVSILKSFIWKDNKSLNYNSIKAPNSQDLPNNYFSLTFGINIISRKNMIKFKNIVGKKPKFIVLNKLESTDINDKTDFKIAQMLYKKTFA